MPVAATDPSSRRSFRRLSVGHATSAGYAALAAADTILAASPSPARRRLRRITKPLLMPMLGSAFSASLTSRGITRGGLLRGATVTAQALSGVGDIALLSSSRPAFLSGLASFLGAHTAYTVAFTSTRAVRPARTPDEVHGHHVPPRSRASWAGLAGAAAAFLVLGPALSRRAGRHDPALAVPVLVYTGAITTMVASAICLDERVPARARRRVVVGSALFLCSDTLLAAREFVLTRPPRWTDAGVMATYTLGQGLIAAGVSGGIQALDVASAPHR